MKSNQIKQIIAGGESVEVEFKESATSLARSVFETICAFLNRKGGHILLGVKDNGEIVGVNEDSIASQLDTRMLYVEKLIRNDMTTGMISVAI